jgi:hypothetical protein
VPDRERRGRTDAVRVPFASIVLLGLVACALVALLPNADALVPVKLAVATYGTLVLPGAVILRLLGWPRSPTAALPACAAWSVAALAAGLVLMLLTDGGLVVAVLWLLFVIGAGLVVGRGKPVEMDVRPSGAVLLFVGAVAVFSALVWIGSYNNTADAVEHIARMRKITELDPPRSLAELGLLPPDSGLHPGYAFPLWHAAGAVIVWISGLEETVMFRFWPSILVPFVAAAVYRAGRTMFGCRAAGAATCVAYLGVFAFPGGVGYFNQLSYPGYICIFLLWPLVIERTFTYVRKGGREPFLTVAAASFGVGAIHPSYAPFMIILIGAFAVARIVVARDRHEFRRLTAIFGAVAVPFLLFLVWFYPAAPGSASTIAYSSARFATLVNKSGDLVSMKPEWLTRGGPAAIAALLLVPVACAATRTRAAAFIASASAVVIFTLLVPWLFTPFADVMSISQGRRFLFYLPWAFALTGGALVLARFRYAAVAGAFVLGVVLYLTWPGDFKYQLKQPGPAWLAWLAGAGALVVLAVGATRKLNLHYSGRWALPIVIALVLPSAGAGFRGMETNKAEPQTITDRLVTAVREYVGREDVVLSIPRTAYQLTARGPFYVAAVTRAHGGDTVLNRSYERRSDARAFFFSAPSPAEARAIIDRWDVQWVLVRKDRPYPRAFLERFTPVYEDERFALYPVDPALQPKIEALKRTS